MFFEYDFSLFHQSINQRKHTFALNNYSIEHSYYEK